MTPAPTDHDAIDLDAIQNRRKPLEEYHGDLTIADVDALIAAVEALREHVVELEGMLEKADKELFDTLVDYTKLVDDNRAKEACVAEVTGALAQSIEDCSVCDGTGKRFMSWRKEHEPEITEEACPRCKPWRAMLAATPAKALERARAVEDVIRLAKCCYDGPPELSDAITKLNALRALGKEGP